MKTYPTITELYKTVSKDSLQPALPFVNESWHARAYGRKISIFLSALFIRTPLSPNAITMLGLITSIIAGIFIAVPTLQTVILGALLIQLYMILDNSDGEVARYKKIFSPSGKMFDTVMHVIAYAALYTGLGVNIYQRTGSLSMLLMGFGAALLFSIASLIFHLSPTTESTEQHVPKQKQTRYSFTPLFLIKSMYSLIVGEVEISLLLLVTAPLFFFGFLPFDIFSAILIINSAAILCGGILFTLYQQLGISADKK